MPKKKEPASPPKEVPPTPDESAVRLQARQRGISDRYALQIKKMRVLVEGMFDGWWLAIRTKQLDRFRSAHAAEDALVQMNRVIGWATFSFRPDPLKDDHGVAEGSEAATEIAALGAGGPRSGIWSPEGAPSSTVIDRHTRFEVAAAAPVIKRPTSSGRPSTPNSGRHPLGRASLTRGRSSISGLMGDTAPSEDKIEIKDLSDPTERSGRKGRGDFHLTDVEKEYFAQIEAEKESKVRREAAESLRVGEALRVKAVWDEAMRDVEGKQWTVDSEGTVIVVNPVEGDKMASRTVPVKYNMGDKKGGDGGAVSSRDRGKGGRGAGAGKASAGGGAASGYAGKGRKDAAGPGHYDESFDSQPPLISTLLPEDGVDLTYGNQTKQGRQFAGVEGHMSRSQYQELTGFSVVGDRTSVDDSTTSPGSAGAGAPTSAKKGGRGKAQGQQATENRFPVINPLKGGRPRALDAPPKAPSSSLQGAQLPISGVSVVSAGPGVGGLDGWSSSSSSSSSRGAGGPQQEVSYEEFQEREAAAVAEERELLSKLNREAGLGGSGAVEPTPVQRQRHQVLPHKHQRDVRNANLRGPAPTAYRSKLAPPTVPGMTTGHGLVGAPAGASGTVGADGIEHGSLLSTASVSPSKNGVVVPEASESKGLRFQVAS